MEKQLCLSVRQVSDNGPQLHIERCFGVLVAPGQHVKHSDMQLLEMVSRTIIFLKIITTCYINMI